VRRYLARRTNPPTSVRMPASRKACSSITLDDTAARRSTGVKR
jgi:hypothetical protein